MKREIVLHPDPILQQVCPQAEGVDLDLITDMFETMYSAPGRGLAAPQIGILSRIFVMDTTWKEGKLSPTAFINPTITAREGTQVNEEGCLSIPDVPRRVERPDRVDVTWTGLDGQPRSGRFEGFAAACVCHEMDHLDGKLILDHPEAP